MIPEQTRELRRFQSWETCLLGYSPWYKTTNEAQLSQEFVKKIRKRITTEEQHIVDNADADLLEQLVSDSLGQTVKNREKHAHNR